MFTLGMRSTKIGGMEKFLHKLSIQMDTMGWDTVLCFDGPPSAELEQYLSLPFVTLENVPNQDGLGNKAAKDLWNVLKAHRPQVFMYAFHSVMRVFPWLAKGAGVSRIYFNDHSSRAQGLVPRPLRLDKRIIARTLTAPLSGIISVSDFTRRSGEAFKMTKAPNTVIRNGIDIYERDSNLRAAFRTRYGLPADALVITQICWMVPIKGVDVALKAASGLLPRYPKVHFLFVGGGEKLEEYRASAAQMLHGDRIHFPGIISEPVKAGVLDATDIYCQPSLWQEASGLAVLEAMSKSIPVVASDIGGLPENVIRDVTGLLAQPDNSNALETALENLIGDSVLRERLGLAGLEKVRAEHQIDHIVAAYADILTGKQQIVDGGYGGN
jgi:glycosyltransferase involved in cell wall biosynthesis